MNILKPSFEIISEIDSEKILTTIEKVARTCYKSEERIQPGSAATLIKNTLMSRNHEAMLEFGDIIVKFTCDRGVTHEIVRHRIASYAQESTRYCNYAKGKYDSAITVIDIKDVMTLKIGASAVHPVTQERKVITEEMALAWYEEWYQAMEDADKHYLAMVNNWCPAELARSVLPNSTKTEINVKFNLREWRHFFKLRTAPAAHPQMREIAQSLLDEFKKQIPVIFDDITY